MWKERFSGKKKLVYSIEAKMLAVRHVSNYAVSKGVDKINWKSSTQKMQAVCSLTSRDYKASPAKTWKYQTKDGKTKHLEVKTWYDRAMQKLYAMSLAPVAESCGDRTSFAHRKGRSTYDVVEHIKMGFFKHEWALIGDVQSFYSSICHKWVLDNIPMAKYVLAQFLKAGFVLNGQLFPKDEGIGLGSSISPIIANMVLDGLQEEISRILQPEAFDMSIPEDERPKINYYVGNMAARWCDDFVVVVDTPEQAQQVWDGLNTFLEDRGLGLSPEKTRIVNIRGGFDFLARHFVKRNGHIFVYPSEAALSRAITELGEIIDNHYGSKESLIAKINEKLTGFATYHKCEQAMDAFRKIDDFVQAKLLDMERRRHPKWMDATLFDRYWCLDHYGRHRFATPDKRAVVRLLSETVLVSHRPVNLNKNYYIDRDYFDRRLDERSINNVTGIYRYIWSRQEGTCYYCGHKIMPDEEKTLATVNGSAKRKTDQYAYIHSRCAPWETKPLLVDTAPGSENQVIDLLEGLLSGKKRNGAKFLPLSVALGSSDKLSITMTFDEIEDILGCKLGKAATHASWWRKTGHETISQCWLDNGFELHKLDIKNKEVTFRRIERPKLYLRVPKIYRTNKMPEEMRVQAELLLTDLAKKYGF